jgi:hypothetical protein
METKIMKLQNGIAKMNTSGTGCPTLKGERLRKTLASCPPKKYPREVRNA